MATNEAKLMSVRVPMKLLKRLHLRAALEGRTIQELVVTTLDQHVSPVRVTSRG